MKIIVTLVVIVIITLGGWYIYRQYIAGAIPALTPPTQDITQIIPGSGSNENPVNETDFPLNLPNGTKLTIYAKNLSAPRDIKADPSGNILVSIPEQGRVVAINPQRNVVGLVTSLNKPHGLALRCQEEKTCELYIAEEDQVIKYRYNPDSLTLAGQEVLFQLPTGGRHTSRSLLINDDKLFTSIGSACDTCEEEDARRGTIYVSNLDGSELKPYATGLRNAVFMTTRPETNEMWATEMGRDFLGDNLPPDEVNIIKENGFYGWPFCYGKSIVDTKFENSDRAKRRCENAIPSQIDLQAHSAPLGITFQNKNTLLVAYHGSWNRTSPTGYKIVRFNLNEDGSVASQEDFITGWLQEGNKVLGRPVDIEFEDENTAYISDDKAGVIYKLEIE